MTAGRRALAELAAPWLHAIRNAGTAISDELGGIAQGSGCSLNEIALLNAFEAFGTAEQSELGGCTALAASSGQGVLLAQNWDANPSLAANLSVQVHREAGHPAFVVLASPGGLGWIGMNDAGLALTNCDLITKATRLGVPSQAVRRLVLRERSVEGAAEVLSSVPAVGGRCYSIGDAHGRCMSFELAAEEAEPVVVADHAPAAHTNHALSPRIARWENRDLISKVYPSTHPRAERAQHLLEAGDADAGSLRDVLADHQGQPSSLCRHPAPEEPTQTAASVVFDCRARTASIAVGRPCETIPRTVSL